MLVHVYHFLHDICYIGIYIYMYIIYIYVLDRFFVLPASCVMSCQNKNGSV